MKHKIIDDGFISRLETLTFHMGIPMRGFFGGNHRTQSYGSTVEFADFREYILGDDLRYIDWNLYSRFEKHFIKLFVDERQMITQVFLDCSASMEKINPEKAKFALKTSAAIGYLAIHNMDRLSFHMMHGNQSESINDVITGKESYYRAVTQLESVDFYGEVNIDEAVMSIPHMGSNDGLCVIVSDFLTENNWKKAVNYLVYKKKQVILIQVLTPQEMDPGYSGRIQLVDCETNHPLDERNFKMKISKSDIEAYKMALKDYQDEIKKFCVARGVHFIVANSEDSIEKLIFQQLEQVGTVK